MLKNPVLYQTICVKWNVDLVSQTLSLSCRVICESELTILCYVNKAYAGHVFVYIWIVQKKIPGLDLKWLWQTIGTVYICFKRISRQQNQLEKELLLVY